MSHEFPHVTQRVLQPDWHVFHHKYQYLTAELLGFNIGREIIYCFLNPSKDVDFVTFLIVPSFYCSSNVDFKKNLAIFIWKADL